MKPELLEHLVRLCVREVLDQVAEEEEKTSGEEAPPAAGLGSGDAPAVPKDKETEPEPEKPDKDEPKDKEEKPEVPPSAELKGTILVNPRDKSKLQKVPLAPSSDDATLERNLHRLAATLAGSQVKVAISTMRMVKDTLRNPNTSAYLYLGKYDPQSDEVFLMADKSLQVAKDASVNPAELTGAPVSQPAQTDFHPMTASPEDFASRMQSGGQTPVRGGVDEQLKGVIKRLVTEILDRK